MDYISPPKEKSTLDDSQLSPVENCRGNTLSPLSNTKRPFRNFGTTTPREFPRQPTSRTPISTSKLIDQSPQNNQRTPNADQSTQKEELRQETQEEKQQLDASEVKPNLLESENDAPAFLQNQNVPSNGHQVEETNQDNNTFGLHTIPVDPEASPRKTKAESRLQSPLDPPQRQDDNSLLPPSTQKKVDKSRLSFSSVDQSFLKSDEKSSNNLLSHLETQAAFNRTVDLLNSATKNFESTMLADREEILRTGQKARTDNKMIEETPNRSQQYTRRTENSILRQDRLLNTADQQHEFQNDGHDGNGPAIDQNPLHRNETFPDEPVGTAGKNPDMMDEEHPETQPKYSIDLGEDALLTHNTPLAKHQPLQNETSELDAVSRNLENEGNATAENSEKIQNEDSIMTGKTKVNSATSKVNTSTSRSGGLASNANKIQPRFGVRDQKTSLPNKMSTSLPKTAVQGGSEKHRAQSISKNFPNALSRKIGSNLTNNSARPSLINKRSRDQIAKSVEKDEGQTKNLPQVKKAKMSQSAASNTVLNRSFQSEKSANLKKVVSQFQNKNINGKSKVNPSQGSAESKENIPTEKQKLFSHPATKLLSSGLLKPPKVAENASKKLPICEICKKELKVAQARTLGCSHKFHTDCYVQSSKKKPGCPLCDGSIKTTPNPVLSVNIKA